MSFIEKSRFTTFEESAVAAETSFAWLKHALYRTLVRLFYNLQFVSLCISARQGLTGAEAIYFRYIIFPFGVFTHQASLDRMAMVMVWLWLCFWLPYI